MERHVIATTLTAAAPFTSSTAEGLASGLEHLLLLLAAACFLAGCFLAMKIVKGDVYHSVPWVPWLVPVVAWVASAVCGYLVIA